MLSSWEVQVYPDDLSISKFIFKFDHLSPALSYNLLTTIMSISTIEEIEVRLFLGDEERPFALITNHNVSDFVSKIPSLLSLLNRLSFVNSGISFFTLFIYVPSKGSEFFLRHYKFVLLYKTLENKGSSLSFLLHFCAVCRWHEIENNEFSYPYYYPRYLKFDTAYIFFMRFNLSRCYLLKSDGIVKAGEPIIWSGGTPYGELTITDGAFYIDGQLYPSDSLENGWGSLSPGNTNYAWNFGSLYYFPIPKNIEFRRKKL